jgi:hypothetical protein
MGEKIGCGFPFIGLREMAAERLMIETIITAISNAKYGEKSISLCLKTLKYGEWREYKIMIDLLMTKVVVRDEKTSTTIAFSELIL